MRPAPPHLRRRLRARRRRFVLGTGAILVLLAAASAWAISGAGASAWTGRASGSPTLMTRTTTPVESDSPTLMTLTTAPVESFDLEAERPRYPFAIVRHGAASVQELKDAIDADPVVRAHYANFNLEQTRIVRLTEPAMAHVSYRIGEDVFWTRRALPLEAGETLLTDGEHYARTRCGNQLALAPAAVSPNEPSAEWLDTPLAPPASEFASRRAPGVAAPLATLGAGALTLSPDLDAFLHGAWTPIPGGGFGSSGSAGPGATSIGTPGSNPRPILDGSPGTKRSVTQDAPILTAVRTARGDEPNVPPEILGFAFPPGAGPRPDSTSPTEDPGGPRQIPEPGLAALPPEHLGFVFPPEAGPWPYSTPPTDDPGPTQVPEPGVVVLLMVAACGASLRRRWNRRLNRRS